MKKKASKKKDLFGTIKSSSGSASSSDPAILLPSSKYLDENNLWDSTFNAVEDAICIIDNEQRIVRCNKAMLKFSVNEREALVGKHCYEVVHRTELPHPECPFQKMLHTNQRESTELQEGGQWFDVTVDPLFGPEKQLAGAVHIIRNITSRKQTEEKLKESEQSVRQKLNEVLSPEGDFSKLNLADIIDADAIQAVMEDFFHITHIGVGLIDLNGQVLVANGWQEICTKFHRINPETCKNCITSDTNLTLNELPVTGKFKAYKCKNNLWDISTPIIVGEKHVGNIFLGQFFYEDETPDYEVFRQQARKYGFDEKEYISALDRVPRWSRDTVKHVVSFYSKFSALISTLSFSNLKLAQALEERNRAEDALKANYSLLRTAGRTAKFGGWKLNLIKKKVTWSDEVAAIHEMPAGYSPKLDEGINFYAPEWRDKITNALNSCAENGTPFDEELELITAKAERIWVRSTGEAVRDKYGNITKIYGSFQDISEHKRREQLISEGEVNARAIMESTSDSMVLLLKDGIVIDSNEGHANRLGLTRSDILGKNIFDYLPEEVGKKRKELIDRAVETGEPQRGEDNRAERWIEYSIHPIFDHNKTIERVAIFAKDITERREMISEIRKSEELLSLFMQHSPIYSFIKEVTPTQSIVLKASENFKDMIGIPGSEMVGKTMYELFPPEFAKKITADDWTIVLEGHSLTYDEELNGRYYNTIKFPIAQVGKNLIAGYTIDVTTQKLAEFEQKKNETRLRELNATKDKFFTIIAHDLKSPFNSIIGFSNILVQRIQENDYSAIEKYAGIIQNSSQQAMDLLMNLLEWSLSQTGRIVYSPEYFDIIALINKSIDLLNGSALQKSITIHLKTAEIMIVKADQFMINTIIRNLISNAIKFTYPEGKIVISVEQNTLELLVSVVDDGMGMTRASMDKLFRIEKTHSTQGTRNEKGTGLGLLLCKEFIDKHNGRIWVESEPGKGSKFFFSIPNGS